jgi:hypothetical protein
MICPGECSDTLRALGRFLELVNASDITIVDRGETVEVGWQGQTGRTDRHLQREDLTAMRRCARFFRGTGMSSPTFGTAEFLRTIGMELDGLEARKIAVAETVEGFWMAGVVGNEEMQRSFSYADLVARVQAYHQQRAPSQHRLP